MEEEPEITEQNICISKRPKAYDGQPDRIRDGFESDRDDLVAEPYQKRRKVYRSAKEAAATASLSSEDLFEVIKGSGILIPQVVKLWVEQYEQDSKPAMVELLTMLFETMLFLACGAKFTIQEDLLDETNLDAVLVDLVNMVAQCTIEDFQSSKKKELRSFKENLVSFWDNLVSECQNGPLFDQVLFDKCMRYVLALSSTPTRVYRLVASLVGLQMVTSFIGVAKMLGTQRQTMQKQLTAEEKETSDGQHIESLDRRLSEMDVKITMIEEMMRNIFTRLFVRRFQDIDPDIRVSCIQSLGAWIVSYPSLFLQDSYLKYLDWALDDISAAGREACILALQAVYGVDGNIVPSLVQFTLGIYERILDLADDIDIPVAVCAISLVKQLLRHQLIPDDDLGSLYDLLIDDLPEIRRAIGELVYDHFIAQNFSSSHPRSSSGDEGDQSQIHLLRMLKILRVFSADQVLSLYIIDAIWEFMDAMKDWELITSMLLYENSSIELTDNDATNLTRLFCASVKKAVGDRIVPAIDHQKRNHTKAQKEIIESSKTVCMMKNYPQLMRKYTADKAKVPSLAEIIVHMDLELYSLESLDENFRAVLELMKEIFFKHGDKDALRSCVRAINYCSSGSPGKLNDYAKNILKEVEDELVDGVKSAIREVADGDEKHLLLVNIKRLYELQLTRPVPFEDLYADIIGILKNYSNIDDEVVGFLLLNMYLHVTWCLDSIMNNRKSVSEESLSSLIKKRNELYERLNYFLQILLEAQGNGTSRNLLACRVCTILAEFWCLFNKSRYTSSKVEPLGYQPAISTLTNFWKLCEYQLDLSDKTEDEDANKEYVEETNRDAIMIAAAKLVSSGAVHKEYLAPNIISHCVMHGATVAEVVKHLVTSIRKREADDVSDIFLEALKLAHARYLAALSTSNDESLTARRLKECEDLASRLSSFFVGPAREESSAVILKIVKAGIDYAFTDAPLRLSFLTCVVINFTSKLPRADFQDILNNHQDPTRNINTDEDPSSWRPYLTFVDALHEKSLEKEDEREGTSANVPDEGKNQVDEDEDIMLLMQTLASAKLRALRTSGEENRRQAWKKLRINIL